MDWIQLALFLTILLVFVKPLGLFIVRILDPNAKTFLDPLLKPIERGIYRSAKIDPTQEQGWKEYLICIMGFSLVSLLFVFIGLGLQEYLPFNPQKIKPPAWHLMSDRQDHVGEVGHCHEKNVWTSVFGKSDSRALVMDGLFLAVNIDSCLKTRLTFDERFDFHHYDITFCLNANALKLKMGVTPIRVVHFGLGDSMNTQEWQQSAQKFQQFYK